MQVNPRTLRRVVGLLGICLPIALLLFGGERQESISAYFDTRVGPVLAGVLFTVGWYLFAYKGYERKDDVAGDIACFAAIGVAVFPHNDSTVSGLHFASATILFLSLIYFCYLFTKGDQTALRKRRRNRVYWTCAAVMVACLLGLAAYLISTEPNNRQDQMIVFWTETLMLWAFGVSWFVKGTDLPGLRD